MNGSMQTQNQGTEQVHPDSESPKTGLRTTDLCGRYISPEDNQVDTLHTDELLLPTRRPFTLQRQETSNSQPDMEHTHFSVVTQETFLHCKEQLTKSWNLSSFKKNFHC